jgi:hypothetical protein
VHHRGVCLLFLLLFSWRGRHGHSLSGAITPAAEHCIASLGWSIAFGRTGGMGKPRRHWDRIPGIICTFQCVHQALQISPVSNDISDFEM